MRYFEAAPAPFFYITARQQQQQEQQQQQQAALAAGDDDCAASDAALAAASLRGLERSGALRSLWRWAPALGLLGHAQPYVRWCAARATALAFGLGDAGGEALLRRVLGEGEALECALCWQGEQAALAAGRAAALLPLPDGASGWEGLDGTGGASVSEGSGGSRKRKFGDLGSPSWGGSGSGAGLGPVPGYVEVGGLELPARQPASGAAGAAAAAQRVAAHPLVRTPAVERNLAGMALGLAAGAPLLLEGPPGAGKSALVEHVAELTGNAEGGWGCLRRRRRCCCPEKGALQLSLAARLPACQLAVEGGDGAAGRHRQLPPLQARHLLFWGPNRRRLPSLSPCPVGMVRLHLDDQMDSKSLVGAYVCTARPGEFVWQPGPLAQAVAGGRWVLVEDINAAPPGEEREGDWGGAQHAQHAGPVVCGDGRVEHSALWPACACRYRRPGAPA